MTCRKVLHFLWVTLVCHWTGVGTSLILADLPGLPSAATEMVSSELVIPQGVVVDKFYCTWNSGMAFCIAILQNVTMEWWISIFAFSVALRSSPMQHLMGHSLPSQRAGYDTIIMTSSGRLSSYGPSGEFNWQVCVHMCVYIKGTCSVLARCVVAYPSFCAYITGRIRDRK